MKPEPRRIYTVDLRDFQAASIRRHFYDQRDSVGLHIVASHMCRSATNSSQLWREALDANGVMLVMHCVACSYPL